MNLFNKALVIYKPVNTCLELANIATTTLRSNNIEVNTLTIDDISTSHRISEDKLLNLDLVVSIGGDGTFIRSAKLFTSTPLILPYPCGRRNSYYERGLPSISVILARVLTGDFHVEFIPLYRVSYEN
jgi:ATP-NAD kinase.